MFEHYTGTHISSNCKVCKMIHKMYVSILDTYTGKSRKVGFYA